MPKYLWLLQTWRINHRRCFRYNFGISFGHEVQKCLLKTSKIRHDFHRFSNSFLDLRFFFSDSIFVLIRYFPIASLRQGTRLKLKQVTSSLSQKRRSLFIMFSCFNKAPSEDTKFLLQKRSVQKWCSCLHNARLRFKFNSASGVASQIHNRQWNVWTLNCLKKSLVKTLCEIKSSISGIKLL